MRGITESKLVDLPELLTRLEPLRQRGLQIVFTNGCFDLLHIGHLKCLEFAKQQGDVLVVAVNSDSSVQRLKGSRRPIVVQADRAGMLASLQCIDFVTLFDADTPAQVIEAIRPDILVKSAKEARTTIVGKDFVEDHGGRLLLAPAVEGISTTRLIDSIRQS